MNREVAKYLSQIFLAGIAFGAGKEAGRILTLGSARVYSRKFFEGEPKYKSRRVSRQDLKVVRSDRD